MGAFTVIFEHGFKGNFIKDLIDYICLNLPFVFFLLGIILTIKNIHKRSFKSLITASNKISWKRFFIGFGIYFILTAISSLVEYFIDPSAVNLYSSASNLLKFLPIALILTFIQTSTEELFFRGYIIQGFGNKIKNPITLSLISGILFMIPHLGNPEVSQSIILLPLYYFGVGFLFALITIKSNGLELAIGAHAANNFFGSYVLNFKGSVLEGTYSIFLTSRFSPTYGLVSFVLIGIIFYFIIFKILKLNLK